MEEEKEININYETLFELLRREKNRQELQKLESSFFNDVSAYLKEKKQILDAQQDKQDLFAVQEKVKVAQQEQNIKKILKELYERRERKIITMAVDAAKTSSIIDTSALLAEEKLMYENLVALLVKFRKEVLLNMLEAKLPELETPAKPEQEPQQKEQEAPEKVLETKSPNSLETVTVKFLQQVPKFVGESLEEYGPFEKGDTAELPAKITDILIKKGGAEKLINT